MTDVVMPGMSGRQLADRLREQRSDLAVVLMTGYTAGMIGVDADDERSEVLAKPFTAGELLAAVRRVAQRRRQLNRGRRPLSRGGRDG